MGKRFIEIYFLVKLTRFYERIKGKKDTETDMIRGELVWHSLHNDKNSHKRAINLRLVALRGYI